MFKQSTASRFRTILRRNDRGIALPMVLIVFLVGFALVTAFLVAIVGSAQVSNTTRSGIQAQAAAEAGIADASLRLLAEGADVCALAGNAIQGENPTYAVTIEFFSGGHWGAVCPESDSEVRMLSTGSAGGSTVTIEQVRSLVVTPAQQDSFPNILQVANTWSVSGDTTIRAADPTQKANIYVTQGDFRCQAGTTIDGSVYVLKGNALMNSDNCKITGDLVVSGNFERGNGSAQILGNVSVGGNTNLGGGGLPVVGKTLIHQGSLTVAYGTKQSWVGGSIRQETVSVPTPPTWIALNKNVFLQAGYKSLDWTGSCSVGWGKMHEMVSKINSLVEPTVIEIPSAQCGVLYFERNGDYLKPKSDVAIIAPTIKMNELHISSGNANSHQLFLVSSKQFDQCNSSESTVWLNGVRMPDGKVSGLAYAPCSVEITNYGGANWRGSVYTTNFKGTPLMTFTPVSIGGSGGTPSGGSGSGSISVGSEVLRFRNVD